MENMHFTENYLLNPTNPVTVNLIGIGGTGSRMITKLIEIHNALLALGHCGLHVRAFDADTVSHANLVRQKFASCELGMNKAVARIQHMNRAYGTTWKAYPFAFSSDNLWRMDEICQANIFITCVDTVKARFEVGDFLREYAEITRHFRDRPYYWIDCGNGRDTGQVILGTVGAVDQPKSKKYRTVGELPMVTEEFADLLKLSEAESSLRSCSQAEALRQQDLFINSMISELAGRILYTLFREGMTRHRGVFVNLRDVRCQPLPVA